MIWIRVDVGFRNHVRFEDVSGWAPLVAEAIWEITKFRGTRGSVSAQWITPKHLLKHLRLEGEIPPEKIAQGIAECLRVGAIAQVEDRVVVSDWEQYQQDPSAKGRMARHRAVVTDVTRTPVTTVARASLPSRPVLSDSSQIVEKRSGSIPRADPRRPRDTGEKPRKGRIPPDHLAAWEALQASRGRLGLPPLVTMTNRYYEALVDGSRNARHGASDLIRALAGYEAHADDTFNGSGTRWRDVYNPEVLFKAKNIETALRWVENGSGAGGAPLDESTLTPDAKRWLQLSKESK